MDAILDTLATLWPTLAGLGSLVVSALASFHVLLRKKDVRSTVGWVGVIWLAPLIGAILYLLLGINRIHRRASRLDRPRPARGVRELPLGPLFETVGAEGSYLADLARLVNEVVARPLVAGNRITALRDGDAAYPEMIAAIDRAERTVTFSTYIYDNDPVGRRLADAFARAKGRGVEVRLLVDAVGLRYTFPPANWMLRRRGLRVARFLPARVPWRMPYMNLRNHRKILVVDGRVGFTGGMNVREGHVLSGAPRHPVQDLHFKLEGPVVAQLQEVFAEDWQFTTGEPLSGEGLFPELTPSGRTLARGLPDGPDEDFDKLRWVLLGVLAMARRSIRIVTPYFLPDPTLASALNLAALRGVKVDIVLPEKSNLWMVQWAATGQLWQVMGHGVSVHLQAPPFDHSKLMVVDGVWALIGSANWDPRSLRLNFELDVECYDPKLAAELEGFVDAKLARSRRLTREELEGRPLPARLRDAVARLFTPYL